MKNSLEAAIEFEMRYYDKLEVGTPNWFEMVVDDNEVIELNY